MELQAKVIKQIGPARNLVQDVQSALEQGFKYLIGSGDNEDAVILCNQDIKLADGEGQAIVEASVYEDEEEFTLQDGSKLGLVYIPSGSMANAG